jgi:hypothetical protein
MGNKLMGMLKRLSDFAHHRLPGQANGEQAVQEKSDAETKLEQAQKRVRRLQDLEEIQIVLKKH